MNRAWAEVLRANNDFLQLALEGQQIIREKENAWREFIETMDWEAIDRYCELEFSLQAKTDELRERARQLKVLRFVANLRENESA